jgi:dTDP-4-dehydrorhamnose 3,5-epimerase
MNIRPCPLAGCLILEPKVFGDTRGFFYESFHAERYAEAGIAGPFVQDNLSLSRRGILRGLHFQNPQSQGKLVSVLQGEVYDVAVDLRRSSPTFGQGYGLALSEANRLQFYIPPGFAHGFQVVSETALFFYKCSAFYAPSCEVSLRWNDPALAIPWPLPDPILSAKDAQAPLLSQLPPDKLFP